MRSFGLLIVGLLLGIGGGMALYPLVFGDTQKPGPQAQGKGDRAQDGAGDTNSPGTGTPGTGTPRNNGGGSSVMPPTGNDLKPAPDGKPNTPPASGSFDELLAAAVAVLPPQPKEAGNGRITGSVKRFDGGGPLAGVLIEAWAWEKRQSRYWGQARVKEPVKPQPEPNAVDVAKEAIERSRKTRSRYFSTMTVADGTYTLSSLPESADLEFTVRAQAMGYAFFTEESQRREGGSHHSEKRNVKLGDLVDYFADSRVPVEVEVLMADGSLAREANVSVRVDTGSNSVVWQASDPFIECRLGQCSMSASVYADADGADSTAFSNKESWQDRSDSASVTVSQTGTPKVTLRIKSVPLLIVAVTKAKDFFGNGVYCACVRVDDGRIPDAAAFANADKRGHVWLGDGRIVEPETFTGLKPGTYAVALLPSNSRARVLASALVTLGNGRTLVSLEVPAMAREDYILVWVYGPDGKYIKSGVDFSISFESENRSSSSGSAGSHVRDDGAWCVTKTSHDDADEDDQKKGKHFLDVSARGLGGRRVEYNPASNDEYTVRFSTPATVIVTIAGFAGHPLAKRLTVGASEKSSDSHRGHSEMKEGITKASSGEIAEVADGKSGAWEFGPFAPGEISVSLHLRGVGEDFYDSLTLSTQTFTVKEGKNTVSVSVPQLYSLTVSAPNLKPGAEITLQSGDGDGPLAHVQRKLDENRKAEFKDLPAGEYKIQNWSSGRSSSVTVSIPAQSSAVYDAKEPDAIKVVIIEEGSKTAAAGFQTGDLIIGADGVEFTGEDDFEKVFDSKEKAKARNFLVLRSGSRLTFSLSPKELLEDFEGGKIMVTPATR